MKNQPSQPKRPTTTIRVDVKTHQVLIRLSYDLNISIMDLVEKAVESLVSPEQQALRPQQVQQLQHSRQVEKIELIVSRLQHLEQTQQLQHLEQTQQLQHLEKLIIGCRKDSEEELPEWLQ